MEHDSFGYLLLTKNPACSNEPDFPILSVDSVPLLRTTPVFVCPLGRVWRCWEKKIITAGA